MIRFDPESNQFVNDNTEAKTVQEAISLVVDAIDEYASHARAKIIGKVSPYEAASWSLKLQEAKGNGGPLLEAEASFRKTTTKNIVDRVLANYEAWSQAEAKLAGVSGFHKDTVRALRNIDAILNYDWRSDW